MIVEVRTAEPPAPVPGAWAAIARVRTPLLGLFLAQAASTSALTTSVALGSIVATRITGSASASGLPATINMVAASLSAFVAGMAMARFGRRPGMLGGYLLGAAGAALGCVFAVAHNLPGFLLGSAMVGAAQAVVLQGRYAAAEMVPSTVRGRVVGLILFGSVIGALAASLLTPVLQTVAARQRWPAIELGWGQSAVMLALGAVLFALLFRVPGGATRAAGSEAVPLGDLLAAAGRPAIRLGVINLVVGQAVMVMLMNLFPVHALHHGHQLGTISAIITVHIAGMFGLAWLTGGLVDRFGAATMSAAGGTMLLVGGVTSSVETSAVGLGAALYMIGLGWNLCFVAGSTLLARNLEPRLRVRFQGAADVLVWLSAGSSTLGGGYLVGVYDYPAVGLLGGVAAALLLLLTGATVLRLRARPAPA